MKHLWKSAFSATVLFVVPRIVAAQAGQAGVQGRVVVIDGVGGTIFAFFGRIIQFLAFAIGAISAAMFAVGCVMIVLSGIKEDYKQLGKDMIIGSFVGAAVTLGAYAIFRTLLYVLGAG